MKRGKYFVIEGIDGTGKTTQAGKLAERLEKENYKTISVTEPTRDMPIGKVLRHYLSGECERYDKKAEAWREMLLFSADRIDLAKRQILPALESGKCVVSDRNYLSTVAYEGALMGDESRMIQLTYNMLHDKAIVKPDMLLIIDISPEESMKRMAKKKKEKFEKEIKFLEEVAKIYRYSPNYFGDHVMVFIDGTGSMEKVHDDIWKRAKSIL
jgi:dTMP kinase